MKNFDDDDDDDDSILLFTILLFLVERDCTCKIALQVSWMGDMDGWMEPCQQLSYSIAWMGLHGVDFYLNAYSFSYYYYYIHPCLLIY